MRDLAETFKALSDETRLQMVGLLLEHEELCVCDFIGALDLTQSKASRHLRNLFHAGLVKDRRDGLWIHYRLSPDLNREQRLIVSALADALGEERRRTLAVAMARWRADKEARRESDADACCGTPRG